MDKYKFDWKDVVYVTIELDTQNERIKENQFMKISLKEQSASPHQIMFD